MASESNPGFLALRDRACAFLTNQEGVPEEALLAHVYSGPTPATLRARLAEPLLGDPRLHRRADGSWALAGRGHTTDPHGQSLRQLAFTTLAVVATGPNPDRGRIVHVAAVHMQSGTTIGRFSVTVNPRTRVPRYVADRIGLAIEVLDDLPPLASTLDDMLRFLDARPIVAQDARLTWAFVEAEAQRRGQALAGRLLIDANELATQLLDLHAKPSLALVAAHLGIAMHRLPRPDEEARVLGLVTTRLLSVALEQGLSRLEPVLEARATSARAALRSGQTVQALSDMPGVYLLRDVDHTPVYIGKARRLRSRMTAYVHRPVGVTRRLEGLVATVASVDSVQCATDLEALILEDREIRRLEPRFNTVRRQTAPRVWIRRPPPAEARPGRRTPAPPRLELSLGPANEAGDGKFVGPFRNESLAAQARLLARRVFALDTLRRASPQEYATRLDLAWRFLEGETDVAIEYARSGPPTLLRQLVDFHLSDGLLPADPRRARYAVLRPVPSGIEGFLVERGIFQSWAPPTAYEDPDQLAARLLTAAAPRTRREDVDVVLRWFGAQRPPTRLIYLPEDPVAAAEAIVDAASALRGSFPPAQA